MIIVCPSCSSRLQIDEAKAPARPVSIRCPKCNGTVNMGTGSPASEQSALAVGTSPATGDPRFEEAAPAPLFELESGWVGKQCRSVTGRAVGSFAVSLVGQNGIELSERRLSQVLHGILARRSSVRRERTERWCASTCTKWIPGLCMPQDTRQHSAYVEEQLDVVLLDPDFDTPTGCRLRYPRGHDFKTSPAATPVLCSAISYSAHHGSACSVSSQLQWHSELKRHQRVAQNSGARPTRLQRTVQGF